MASSSTPYFQLHQSAEAFIRSYDYDECVKDVGALSKTLAPSCEYHTYPTSIHDTIPFGKPPVSNKKIEEQAALAFKYLRLYKLEAKDITVDEVQRKAVVQTVHNISMKPEYGDDTCAIEAVFTLWMTKDGTAIEKLHHFVDSLAITRFFEEQKWVSRRPEGLDPG